MGQYNPRDQVPRRAGQSLSEGNPWDAEKILRSFIQRSLRIAPEGIDVPAGMLFSHATTTRVWYALLLFLSRAGYITSAVWAVVKDICKFVSHFAQEDSKKL